jgi:iron(III) transport system ATP-binding protein
LLLLEPAVLLFDEPLSNLDARLRRCVRQEIRELQQELKLTALHFTHDQSEASAVSDETIVMDGGRIAQQGSPRTLYREPVGRFMADFIGDANLVDGELVTSGASPMFGAAGVPVLVRPPPMTRADPATLAMRPHRRRLTAPENARLQGTCQRADSLGSHFEMLVDSPWGELLFADADAPLPAAGAPLGLAFDAGDAIVIPP